MLCPMTHRSTREFLQVAVAVVWYLGLLGFAPYWHGHVGALILWIVGGLALMPALTPRAPATAWRFPAGSGAGPR